MSRRSPLAAAIVVGAATLALAALRRLTRVTVEGASMLPALEPGDRLLVRRTARVHEGSLVVVADPRRPSRWMVKRVDAIAPDGAVIVHGDNPAASTDSRTLGPLPASAVIGRPVYRYAPRARAGPLDRP